MVEGQGMKECERAIIKFTPDQYCLDVSELT
jgi:hypothetical protein